MLRLGKPEVDLSEMFFVRNAYPLKALKYVRLHGSSNFGPGGQAHDVINMIRDYGIVPDEIYNGKNLGESKHYHNEMDAVLKAMLDAIVNNKDGKISTAWKSLVENTLDTYLGKIPTTFNYSGKSYNAISFKKDFCGINPDDYIEITSFNHHPFYQKLDLEVPDNWSNGLYYNLPMNEMMSVIENALSNGYESVEEYFCDSFVDYIQRKNIDPELTKDMEAREITNYDEFDSLFESMLYSETVVDEKGIIKRLNFVMKILE